MQKIQHVYNELFTIYQQAEKLGEQFETVVGLGCLAWNSPSSQTIRHPLLTFKVRLDFDRAHGIISVMPSDDVSQNRNQICIDMLEPDDRPIEKDFKAIEAIFAELEDDLWCKTMLENFFRSFANGLSSHGSFKLELSPPGGATKQPVIHLAPLLILRKRSRQAYKTFYEQIIQQIDANGIIPESVRYLVDVVETERRDDEWSNNKPNTQLADPELYFPLPANDEQKLIAERLSYGQGLLVQGPPGTGKSHTIANLVAHLLAQGKRVLVTSETPRALTVLKDKLPDSIQELCVIWLGSDTTGQEALERSVKGITNKQNTWDNGYASKQIQEFEKKLVAIRQERAKTFQNLVELRYEDAFDHKNIAGRYSGKLQHIARLINTERHLYEWFLDRPPIDESPDIRSSELLDMHTITQEIDDDQTQQIRMRTIPSESLLEPAVFIRLVENEARANHAFKDSVSKRTYDGYSRILEMTEESRSNLLDLLLAYIQHTEKLSRQPQKWIKDAIQDITTGHSGKWNELLESSQTLISKLDQSNAGDYHVSGLRTTQQAEAVFHAQQLLEHFESGGGLGFWGPFRPQLLKRHKYLVKEVRVNGTPCSSPDSLQMLIERLRYEKNFQLVKSHWMHLVKPPKGNLSLQLASYRDLCNSLREAMALRDLIGEMDLVISANVGLPPPQWGDVKSVNAFKNAIEAVDDELRLIETKKQFLQLEHVLCDACRAPSVHPLVMRIDEAVRCRDVAAYHQLYEDIMRLNNLRSAYEHSCCILEKFSALAPLTCAEYHKTAGDDVWRERFEVIDSAWAWAQTDQWLHEKCQTDRAPVLSKRIEQANIKERELIKNLATQKAWQQCMLRLGERERQSLIAWMQEAKKIRGGKGKYAEGHRKMARQKLSECRKAVPAWIMPLYQVAQTISPEPNAFDVVIVDEASQSGPEALLLNYITDKLVVVGDDKQIRPLYVGVSPNSVTYLRNMHLGDIPQNQAFDLDSTLYSQAELRFAGRVILREHFRCMPEIIQFSNKLCYQSSPLIPLRQYGAVRLPPVLTRHVSGGYREGRSPNIVNRPEALAIVNQIAACIHDPVYEGKTFGVISLLGNQQSALIGNLLLNNIGADEIES